MRERRTTNGEGEEIELEEEAIMEEILSLTSAMHEREREREREIMF